MKKTIFSAAAFAVVAVSAIAAAPTTSEAVPAFARQTGAACLSCHFQAFPALTSFGAAFKRGAFTSIGEEALLEDDGLSLPVVLNMSINSRIRFTKLQTTTTTAAGTTSTTVNDALLPDETPIFIGGRIGTNTGAFMEYTGGTAGGWQLMNSMDMGDYKVGLNLFNGGFGWTWGLETSSVFAQHGGLHQGKNISVQNALTGSVEGLTAFVGNELFTASVVGVTAGGPAANGLNALTTLMPGLRVWFTPEVADWNLGMGFGILKGNKSNLASGGGVAAGLNAANVVVPGGNLIQVQADNVFFDFQAMGEVGDTSVGVFADYAVAKSNVPVVAGTTFVNLNGLAAGQKLTGYSIRTTVEPIHNAIFSIGYGKQTLKNTTLVAGVDQNTTFLIVGTSYSFYQNFEVALTHQITSITNAANVAGNSTKIKQTMLQLEAVM